MNKRLAIAIAGTILVLLLAWSSLASAAPSAAGVVLAPSSLTATPAPTVVDTGGTADNVPEPAAPAGPINPGNMTSRIFIFNLDTANAATVGITFYKPDGTSAGSIAPFTIPANGAAAKALPGTITTIPFKGSALVSSNRNVQAFVTDSNGNNTARDEYDGTGSPSPNLVLPFVRHLAPNTQNSIIAVQNTGNAPANITLQLYQPNGSLGPSQTLTAVPPLASRYFDTGSNFGLSAPFTGSAEISSSGGVALAGGEQTRYMQDTASFRALSSADDAPTLYVGFVERRRNSTGTPISWSEIYVRNDGGSATDITAKFYSAAGVQMSGLPTTATFRPGVQPNGQASFVTKNPGFQSLTPPSTAYFKGWAMITSSGSQPLSLYSLEAQNSGNRLFGTNGVTATGNKFACGDTFRYTSPSQNSQINIVNPNSTAASVTVKLYKQNGSTGSTGWTKTLSVPARRLVTFALSDAAFNAVGSTFEGLAVVTATGQKVFATVYTAFPAGGITSYTCTRLQ